MTPERIEEIREYIDGLGVVGSLMAKELLAALEEAEKKATEWEQHARTEYMIHNEIQDELREAQQTIARQREALEFLADDENWSWSYEGTEDEMVTWVGGTDPQDAAREAMGIENGETQP